LLETAQHSTQRCRILDSIPEARLELPMTRFIAGVVFLTLTACASVSTIPLSKDTFQITSNAVGACGPGGAQKVAFQQAAAETIRRGYDSFQIMGTDRQSQLETASIWAGATNYGHSYSQGLTVKMYHDGDPSGAQAISARETLGPKWQEAIKTESSYSCT
jgi:hypothetical protein